LQRLSDLEPSREHPHVPGPSLWPVGLALGVVILLVGFIVSAWVVVIGAVVTVGFGLLWVRDLAHERGLAHAPDVEAEGPAAPEPEVERPPAPLPTEPDSFAREKFLEASTLGLGALIGALVTLPVLGFTIVPAFLNQGRDEHDLGPLEEFPEGQWMIATFMSNPPQGEVSRLTAFVRYNGLLEGQPSFTMLSNHCVHLGCPTQPNGPTDAGATKEYKDVTLIPAQPSSFGCPCHGGQYDTEGNRKAGPPVRALDRFTFSIKDDHLFIGEAFSVANVEGTGATARIFKHPHAFPGVHVDGIESWLYPIQPSQLQPSE
jgi:Rieske Fe-S protein